MPQVISCIIYIQGGTKPTLPLDNESFGEAMGTFTATPGQMKCFADAVQSRAYCQKSYVFPVHG